MDQQAFVTSNEPEAMPSNSPRREFARRSGYEGLDELPGSCFSTSGQSPAQVPAQVPAQHHHDLRHRQHVREEGAAVPRLR